MHIASLLGSIIIISKEFKYCDNYEDYLRQNKNNLPRIRKAPYIPKYC